MSNRSVFNLNSYSTVITNETTKTSNNPNSLLGSSSEILDFPAYTFGVGPFPTSYILAYLGTSVSIPWDTDISVIQSELEQFPNIGIGNISVTDQGSGIYRLTFQGSLANLNLTDDLVYTPSPNLAGFSLSVISLGGANEFWDIASSGIGIVQVVSDSEDLTSQVDICKSPSNIRIFKNTPGDLVKASPLKVINWS